MFGDYQFETNQLNSIISNKKLCVKQLKLLVLASYLVSIVPSYIGFTTYYMSSAAAFLLGYVVTSYHLIIAMLSVKVPNQLLGWLFNYMPLTCTYNIL